MLLRTLGKALCKIVYNHILGQTGRVDDPADRLPVDGSFKGQGKRLLSGFASFHKLPPRNLSK